MKTIFINSSLEIFNSVKECLIQKTKNEIVFEQASLLSESSLCDPLVTHLIIPFDCEQLGEYEAIKLMLGNRPDIRILVLYNLQDYDLVRSLFSMRGEILCEIPRTAKMIADLIIRSVETSSLSDEQVLLQRGLGFDKGRVMIGQSGAISKIYLSILKLARVETSVLVTGESGTGKELVARALHYNSKRQKGPFVAVNCAALPDSLIESELFGHDKGAYTGADRKKIGKFQFAEGGTLFLDEIGDISASLQVKLLRVLQERSFTPMGSNIEIKANTRIIAATNRSLEKMVSEGTFRADLFYRLNILPLELPPLRDRREDIDSLVDFFIDKFTQKHERTMSGIESKALNALMTYSWPGNVRELENVIEHAFIVETNDTIHLSSLPLHFSTAVRTPVFVSAKAPDLASLPSPYDETSGLDSCLDSELELNYPASKERFEREFLARALQAFDGRINKTAANTKMTKVTLLRKLDKYQIDPRQYYPGR